MKQSEQDQLLKDLLGDDSPSNLRTASLEQSLAALRRRRHQRRVAATAVAAMLFIAAGGLLLQRFSAVPSASLASNSSRAQGAAPPAENPPAIKFISDDELLALFPGRSVGLIGSPGHQTLEFFDEPSNEQ